MHVDHFTSREGDDNYISFDAQTGEVTYSAEFRQHLRYWEDTLAELMDPLVEAGYIQWASLQEMGERYVA
jgi:hypothetical protein